MLATCRCRQCSTEQPVEAEQITVDEETPLGSDKRRWVVIWHCRQCGRINTERSYPRQVAVLLVGGALCLPQARFADAMQNIDHLAPIAKAAIGT